jgi:uncharacterized membrane protein
MRKTLEIIALLLMLFLWAATAYAILGPNPLPARMPTHFNPAGQPDGWGAPAMLWIQPAIATGIYLLMTLVGRFPSTFNFPLRASSSARRQLEVIALNMISWLKAEVICLLAWIQYWSIHIMRQGQGRVSPISVPLLLIVVFATIAWHLTAMSRAARRR